MTLRPPALHAPVDHHPAHVAGLADHPDAQPFARQIATTLSREAGLYTAHEMMESLDPNYHSELAETLMVECERLLDSEPVN